MEDKLLGLYNDFKNAGLFKDTKDYGTFRQRMQGQGYQAQIYKVAKQNGADVGQFWQFQRNFGLGRWAGGSRQAAKPTKPLTTSQRANMVAQESEDKSKTWMERKRATIEHYRLLLLMRNFSPGFYHVGILPSSVADIDKKGIHFVFQRHDSRHGISFLLGSHIQHFKLADLILDLGNHLL